MLYLLQSSNAFLSAAGIASSWKLRTTYYARWSLCSAMIVSMTSGIRHHKIDGPEKHVYVYIVVRTVEGVLLMNV